MSHRRFRPWTVPAGLVAVVITVGLSVSIARALPVEKLYFEGFKKVAWGSTLDQIKRHYPDLSRRGTSETEWMTQTTFARLPAQIVFYLKAGRLVKWEGVLLSTYASGPEGENDFMRLENALMRKYKAPLSREGPDTLAASEAGALRLRSRWKTSESRIGLILARQKNGRWTVQFMFESFDLLPKPKPSAP